MPPCTSALSAALGAFLFFTGLPDDPPPAPETSGASVGASASQATVESDRQRKEQALRRRFLPEPIPRERLERMSKELAFNEENAALFPQVIERYEAAWRQIRGEEARRLEILLPAAFRFDHARADFDEVYTPELLSVLRLRDRLTAQIDAAEDALAREITLLSDPEKIATLQRLRLARVQELYGLPARLPAAEVNLIDLVDRTGLSADEIALLHPFFTRYSDQLAEALRLRHRHLLDLEQEESDLLTALGPEWRSGYTADEIGALEHQLAQIAVASVLADMPVRDLNQIAIVQLRRQLAPASARKVMEAYQRLVHPGLFEDERSFHGHLEALLALPNTTPEQVTAAVDISAAIEERLRSGGQLAVELADGIITAARLPPGDAVSARVLLEAKLQETLTRRRSVLRDGYRQLGATLAGEQTEFARRLDDALATLTAQDRASGFLIQSLQDRAQEIEILRALDALPEQPLRAEDLASPDGATESRSLPPPETRPVAPGAEGDGPPAPIVPSDDRPRRGSRRGR